jgi:hypothetical protein
MTKNMTQTTVGFAKWLVMAAAFVGGSVWSSDASADYLCYSTYRVGGSWGSEGNLGFSVYSGPSCTGSFVGNYVLCSTGATSTACAITPYRFERHSLLAYLGAMQRAAAVDQKIWVSTSGCNGGGYPCASSVYFDAD